MVRFAESSMYSGASLISPIRRAILAQSSSLSRPERISPSLIRASADSISLSDWNRVVAVNLTGMFLAARLAARLMAPTGGAIVNTASIMGLSGGIYPNVAYQTTKGGVVNMTRALALEWVRDNIRVNAVAPTFVNTGFIAPITGDAEKLGAVLAATPMHRLAEPEEIADAIVFLASSAASMITGVTLPVDGGFLAR